MRRDRHRERATSAWWPAPAWPRPGNDVVCADVDAGKIARLRRNEIPIYEPGLEPLVRAQPGRGAAALHHRHRRGGRSAREVVFIAVGTPPGEDGSADLQHVLAVARGHRAST